MLAVARLFFTPTISLVAAFAVDAQNQIDVNGRADRAVFRPSSWDLMQATAGFGALRWGVFSDLPTPNAFVW